MVDAGWYKDPEAPSQLRWWDGAAWTEHRHAPAPTPVPVFAAAAATLPDVAPQWAAPTAPSEYGGPPQAAQHYAAPQAVPQQPYAQQPSEPLVHERGHSYSSVGISATPAKTPRRGPNPLLIAGGAVVVIAAIVVAFVLFRITPASTASAKSSMPPSSTTTSGSQGEITLFGTVRPPDGMTPLAIPPQTIVTAGNALNVGATVFPNTNLSKPQCVGLSYSFPVTATDQGSGDQIRILPAYTSGGPSPAIIIGGYIRDFGSSSAAQDSLDAMTALLNSCQGTYTNKVGTVKVFAEGGGFGTDANQSWIQAPASSAKQIEIMNYMRGSSILRVTCVEKDYHSEITCSQWDSALVHEFDTNN